MCRCWLLFLYQRHIDLGNEFLSYWSFGPACALGSIVLLHQNMVHLDPSLTLNVNGEINICFYATIHNRILKMYDSGYSAQHRGNQYQKGRADPVRCGLTLLPLQSSPIEIQFFSGVFLLRGSSVPSS